MTLQTIPDLIGIDIGSTTVKVVVLDAHRQLIAGRYVPSSGRPRQTLTQTLLSLQSEMDLSTARAALTGSGGGPIARQIGLPHINELIAQTRAVGEYHPDARTVIEMGGQDSKLLLLDRDPRSGQLLLVDFGMNALCAAGTGSFLDQQAERLGIRIENEFAALALQSQKPARVAGRCTVFAKSDMIHLQQRGVPVCDILAGLCYALTRNFKSVIGRGKRFIHPILFQGGVASNLAVVRAFEDVLGLAPGELIIPQHYRLMAALGAALALMDNDLQPPPFDLESTLAALGQETPPPSSLKPLRRPIAPFHWQRPSFNGGPPLPVYLGIDVGSISTNVVLIDEQHGVVARRYLRTAGRPLEAVRQGLAEIGTDFGQMGGRVRVRGVGVTGSGRYLIGEYVGADVVRNEITAQARAAVSIDPTIDTLFEIGGQDSKYIRLENGRVIDFTMNKACAAGTGSFLEEQADRLGLDIARDFGRLALQAQCPAPLGERCTVFMESDLVHCQQQGAGVSDLTAGLAYSIAQNYINRVVNGRPIGQRIFFQGGVASNPAVVAAFEQWLGQSITVPPHHDVTGAIGAAILAQEDMGDRPTRFRGLDLTARPYQSSSFECAGCVNHCEITRIVFGDDHPLFYGARCERYEQAAHSTAAIPDLFARRQELLLRGYEPPASGRSRPRVGIPRTLLFYDMFPYWHRFLSELGCDVVLSSPTNPRLVQDTWENTPAETCFPVKLMQGHTLDLLRQGVDWLFLPSVVSRENPAPGQQHNTYCPFIQAAPQLVINSLLRQSNVPALSGPVYLLNPHYIHRSLADLMRPLGVSLKQVRRAADAAGQAQRDFYADLRRLGQEYLPHLEAWPWGVVLVGRPYNTCDDGVSMALPLKLRKLGVLPLPIDCLPVEQTDVSSRFDNLYWRCGQDILAAAQIIRSNPRLQAIYVTNFGCGPDSFLLSFFRRAMDDKLYLELEIDDHSADAGVTTRCEAFLDSLNSRPG